MENFTTKAIISKENKAKVQFMVYLYAMKLTLFILILFYDYNRYFNHNQQRLRYNIFDMLDVE